MATAEARTEKIAGGFVLIDAAELLHAWRTCQDGEPGAGGFRAWLACREMIARRRGLSGGRLPSYSVAELARLTGTTTRTAAASVRRLVAAGLLEWSDVDVKFPDHPPDPAKMIGDTIAGGRGAVSIPRRLLRFLARGARTSVIAVAIGAVLRCVSRRRSGWDLRGRFKASWVASVFGISARQAKSARSELIAAGWLEALPGDQWAANRWGGSYRVRVDADRHPSPADPGAIPSPPDLHPAPLREEEHPEPGTPGPAGASLGREGEPNLRDIRPADLVDTARVLALHGQAVAAGKVTASEADRVRFVAAAEHARAIGTSNPPGLLARIVSTRAWHLLTQCDEDRAARRLREHQRPADPQPCANLHKADQALLFANLRKATPVRSPYGAERPTREASSLAGLLARSFARHCQQSE